ncbi:GrpB family protein [Bacillus sp. GM2]|uniref:GrpB family protein n=1 Tax=Bacillus sp. GM2 TaxID=3373599 RepID=UPI003F9204FA
MEQEIIIEKAKAGWVQEFESEKQRLTDALGKKVIAVEHIGSTSVPGCGKTGARSDGRRQQSQRSFSVDRTA